MSNSVPSRYPISAMPVPNYMAMGEAKMYRQAEQ